MIFWHPCSCWWRSMSSGVGVWVWCRVAPSFCSIGSVSRKSGARRLENPNLNFAGYQEKQLTTLMAWNRHILFSIKWSSGWGKWMKWLQPGKCHWRLIQSTLAFMNLKPPMKLPFHYPCHTWLQVYFESQPYWNKHRIKFWPFRYKTNKNILFTEVICLSCLLPWGPLPIHPAWSTASDVTTGEDATVSANI